MAAQNLTYLLFSLLIVTINWSQITAQDLLTKVNSDYDESSCICGLNSRILDQLELIVRTSTSSCGLNNHPKEVPALDLDPKTTSHLRPMEITENTPPKEDAPKSNTPTLTTTTTSSPIPVPKEEPAKLVPEAGPVSANKHPEQQVTAPTDDSAVVNKGDNNKNNSNQNHASTSSSSISSSSSSVSTITLIEKLTVEIQKLEQQIKEMKEETSSSGSEPSTFPESPKTSEVEKSEKLDKPSTQVVDTGFLNGLVNDPNSAQNEALMKLNQSKRIEPQEMASALQSTVPNVVSNIFSNIQNLTIQEEQQPLPAPLAGSSMVKGNTTDEITASGEKIFLAWIEHQLDTLHLTASVANYIRRSSMDLFKKIAKQYVRRVSQIGDSFEDNMRRATQMALNNTQSLIAYLLKNYINFAGGLMQIIGDQVSRVGKQLDTTGDTIAHTSLNPFDIVSNVMESLPNPSDYSKYFRAFGKQLMGQFTNQNPAESSQANETNSQLAGNQNGSGTEPPHKSQGLISKTMGALGKTLGSWLG